MTWAENHQDYLDAASDGAGRIWVFVGDETEAYDERLALVSRHHMRGEVLYHYLDRKGRLCAVTYDGEKHIVRVYRLA